MECGGSTPLWATGGSTPGGGLPPCASSSKARPARVGPNSGAVVSNSAWERTRGVDPLLLGGTGPSRRRKRRRAAALQMDSPNPNLPRFPSPNRLKLVVDLHPVHRQPVDRPDLRVRRHSLEPSRRTPGVLRRHGNETMPYRVLMDVVQSRKVAFLVRQSSLEIVVPDLPAGHPVASIQPSGRARVEVSDELRKGGGSVRDVRGRMGDEVVVIREDRPRLKPPTVLRRVFQKTAVKGLQGVRIAEAMRFFVGSHGHDEGARLREPVFGGMGPLGFHRIEGRAGRLIQSSVVSGVEPPIPAKRRQAAALQT